MRTLALLTRLSLSDSDYALIIVENPLDGGSVLTQESLNALWELDGLVMDIEV